MDPSLGIAGLADVQNAGPPKELKTFDTTIELGQTEYTTKCFGEVGTGVKAQGNRAAAACSQKAFLCKRRSEREGCGREGESGGCGGGRDWRQLSRAAGRQALR